MATSVVKHQVKHSMEQEVKDKKHSIKNKTDFDVDKKLRKKKHKMERKAIKAVL